MTDHDVVVVGAGLAGLACARALAGLDVVVLESGDAVGGRVRTDRVDGFTLDRGFQVLNTGYPELRRTVDLDALDLRPFDPAAGLAVGDRSVTLGNPLQRPSTAVGALQLPVGGLLGKAALASYAARCVVLPPDRLRARPDVSSERAWREAGIPAEVVAGVLRPFFTGVLLEQKMSTSRRFTDLMMRMFVRGASTVPAAGMQALPAYLAERLDGVALRLDTPVRRVTPTLVETDAGPVTARAVVVATDAWTAADLVPALPGPPPARGVTTVYHAAPDFPEASSMLLLDAGDSPLANTIAISRAAPEYAPAGRVLVATSLVHTTGGQVEPDGPNVRAALARLHRTDTSRWEVVATYDLPHALPGMPAPHPLRRPVRVHPGPGETVYVAGDHRDTSSIQGALVSGRRAAQAVLTDLSGRSPAAGRG